MFPRRLAILASVLIGCATLGPQLEWGVQYTTPGTQLSFEDRGSPTVPLGCIGIKNCPYVIVRIMSYRIRASGFPQGIPLTLWKKRLGRLPEVVRSDVFIDESGTVVQPHHEFGPFAMETGGVFVKGEPYEVTLISADQKLRAFAKIIPFPNEASDGRCLLTLELLSTKGEAVAILGQGFEANEEIVTVSEYTQDKTDRVETRFKTPPDGKFVIIESPPVMAKQSGAASFTAIGKSCKLTVSYEWGVPLPEPARM